MPFEESREKVDVIVVGSGQAGVPLATRLAAAGKSVVLFERSELGGTCVNVGCTPTKTMIASARAAHVARTAGRLGVHVGEVRVDLAAVVDRKDAIVGRWRDGVRARLRAAGERCVSCMVTRASSGRASLRRALGATWRTRSSERRRAAGRAGVDGLDSVPFHDNSDA